MRVDVAYRLLYEEWKCAVVVMMNGLKEEITHLFRDFDRSYKMTLCSLCEFPHNVENKDMINDT